MTIQSSRKPPTKKTTSSMPSRVAATIAVPANGLTRRSSRRSRRGLLAGCLLVTARAISPAAL